MPEIYSIDLVRDELNEKFGGGIPKGAFMLIEAPNTVGKSILAQRLTFGFLSNKVSATYISTELNMRGFINQMHSVKFDVMDKIFQNQLLFISAFTMVGNVNVDKHLIDRLFSIKEIFDKDVIVFDALSYIIIHDDIDMGQSFKIIDKLKKLNKTLIFCVDPDNLNPKFLSILRQVSDIYFRMEVKEQFGTLVRIMKIDRFNGAQAEVTTSVPFSVKAGMGIVVETSSLS